MDRDLNKLNLQDYKPLRDIVFESLKEAIIEGKLKPGERLMEMQLAERLGVSRTPIREAIRKLELEGLVVMVPRKGAYVTDVSLKDIIDVLEIRASLEGLAASLAAQRITSEEIKELELKTEEFGKCYKDNDIEGMIKIDTELHDIIFRAARNERLIGLTDSLREHVQRFRVTYMTEYKKSAKLIEEHKKILEAIKKGDVEKARAYAQIHVENAENYLVKEVKVKIKK